MFKPSKIRWSIQLLSSARHTCTCTCANTAFCTWCFESNHTSCLSVVHVGHHFQYQLTHTRITQKRNTTFQTKRYTEFLTWKFCNEGKCVKAPHCRFKGSSHNHSMPCVLSRCFIVNMILFLHLHQMHRNTRIESDLSWVRSAALRLANQFSEFYHNAMSEHNAMQYLIYLYLY